MVNVFKVSAIIVFGTISDKGTIKVFGQSYCLFNNETAHCNYGIAVGVRASNFKLLDGCSLTRMLIMFRF